STVRRWMRMAVLRDRLPIRCLLRIAPTLLTFPHPQPSIGPPQQPTLPSTTVIRTLLTPALAVVHRDHPAGRPQLDVFTVRHLDPPPTTHPAATSPTTTPS